MHSATSFRNTRLAIVAMLVLAACGSRTEQQEFTTPEAAFEALAAATEKNDTATMQRLLGAGVDELISSGDAVQDAADRSAFVKAYQLKHSIRPDSDGQRVLVVGERDWPLPIPAVQRESNWVLDGEAGADELVYRRVGENELGAIAVVRGFVEAQREYAAQGHDGDPAGIYALKLVSDPGLQNGLYWETQVDEAPSPAGAFIAAAAAEGYRASADGITAAAGSTPYHGYRYRMLFTQGAHAKGGAREYFQDGLLTQGFALVAWPAEYNVSGVMTFIVNQDGEVYEKDLNDATSETVSSMKSFDPDDTWHRVPDVSPKADAGI